MKTTLKKSIKKFKQFNFKDPKKIKKISIDFKSPLIKIGEVPEVTYISDKEGKRKAYKHKTTKPFPVLYGSPEGKFFVIIGGNIKIKDWLYN